MVFLNYTAMQMTAKIVYYGPGLCGKTTNLQWIHGKTAPRSRGEMVSLETEADRTLFFDLLPLDVGVIGGMKVRLQLYTVPGQVFYNATRRLVLKGVDGVVFVADSQVPAAEPNEESLANLRQNLEELGLDAASVPARLPVQQAGPAQHPARRDAPAGPQPGRRARTSRRRPSTGSGVFETLKEISRLSLDSIRAKIAEQKRRGRRRRARVPRRAAAGRADGSPAEAARRGPGADGRHRPGAPRAAAGGVRRGGHRQAEGAPGARRGARSTSARSWRSCAS